jgi:hypothetical protein
VIPSTFFYQLTHSHGRPQGGALAPLLAGQGWPKILCFRLFLGKIVSFLLFFRQKLGSCPPGKFLPSPGKKSADAHAYSQTLTIYLRSSDENQIFNLKNEKY